MILMVMATFVLTALALGKTLGAAQYNLQKSLGGSFLFAYDYSGYNLYLRKCAEIFQWLTVEGGYHQGFGRQACRKSG